MFYTPEQLQAIGFASLGHHVLISDKASIYNPANIHIGNDVRVDDFCILSAGEGGIHLGNYIHLSHMTTLIGAGAIIIEDFCNISGKCSIYSSSDDFSGEYLAGAMTPRHLTQVRQGRVHLKKYVIVGTGSVVLPDVVLGEGCAVGALSLVSASLEPYMIYGGSPLRKIKERRREMVKLALTL